MPFDAIAAAVKAKFADVTTSEFRDNRRLHAPPAHVYGVLQSLKDEHGFDMLFELTAADYLKYPNATDRFGVVLAKHNPLTSCVNKAITTLRTNGTLKKLQQLWLAKATGAPILK